MATTPIVSRRFWVLLIPRRIREIRLKERKEQQKLRKEAYKRFGIEVDGVVMLPNTPDVEAFLNSESENE